MSSTIAPLRAARGPTEPGRPTGGMPRWPVIALVLAMAAAAALLLYLTRGFTFFYDEWNFLINRQAFTADALLKPHNEHNVAVTVLLFKGAWELAGLGQYWVFRVLVVGLHLLCAGVLYVYARRRVGPVLALAPAVVLLFLGTAWEIILWPFEIQFMIPVTAGMGMLLFLERRDPRSDLAASGLLLLAFASGSLGIPMAAGAAVEILFGGDRLRRVLRVLAVPVGLYLVWLSQYDPFRARFGTYGSVPQFVWDQLGSAIAALAGFAFSSARMPALVAGAALALLVAVAFIRGAVDRGRMAAIVTMALAYWGALALYRPWVADDEPSRYLYGGAVFVLLAGLELARGRHAGHRTVAVVGVLALVAVASNFDDMRDGAHRIRDYSDYVAPGLGALELARGQVAADFKPEPNRAPDIVAGRYFDAVDRWGSPADTPKEIARRSEGAREAADVVLVEALRLELRPAAATRAAGTAPEPTQAAPGSVRRRGGCLSFVPGGTLAALDARLPAGGIRVTAQGRPAVIQLRRFADGFLPEGGTPGSALFANNRQAFGRGLLRARTFQLAGGQTAVLRIARDAAPRPWQARFSTAGRLTACGLPR